MRVKLADVATIRGGKRLPLDATFETNHTDHPYIRARDIGDGKVEIHEPVFLAKEVAAKLARYTVKAHDICLTIVGANVGDIGTVPPSLEGANLTENAVKISSKGKAVQTFLKYALLSNDAAGQMKVLAGGAAQPKLGIYKIETIEIPLPSETLQKRIADILLSYDELIENNKRRIRVLEEVARSLYREWFVHFRFPGHENHPRVASSLGEIPQGWDVKKLGDILELVYGKALKAEHRRGGPVPVYGSSGVVGAHDVALTAGPGVIVGRKGNVGSIAWSDNDFFVIDTAFYVKSVLPMRFLYHALQGKSFLNSDAAVPGLNREQAYSLEQIVPSMDTIERFVKHAEELGRLATVLEKQVDNLRQTRDLLLPRLLCGQIKVEAN